MQEVTIKKDSSVVLDDEVKLFLNPKFVFLPIKEGYKLKVSDKDYVYMNDIVAVSSTGTVVRTTASGRVLGLKRMDYFKEKGVQSLVIENDFKENIRTKRSARRYIADYTKDEFLGILKDVAYRYKGEDLVSKYSGNFDTIIVNGVELDPYFGNKHFIWKENEEDILEICDFLGTLVGAKKIYFVCKNTDSELITKMTSLLGTYPNIELKLVSNAYPNGFGCLQKKILRLESALVVDIEEASNIFRILKRENPVTSKLITITGDAVNPKTVIRVKLGALLSEVFVHNFDFTLPKVDVYINGTLYGEKVDSLKCVLDDTIDGIFVTEKGTDTVDACLNCGQCSKTCPLGLNPKFVFDHDGKVDSEYFDKCIQCGLCNYVCPANRDLKSRMKGCDNS